MTNFIFKSQGTYKKLANNIEVILNEQRHQRMDLSSIIRRLVKIDESLVKVLNDGEHDENLQKQVDEYFETSPQTESDKQSPPGFD